jgi:signal transduction histidine kinase
MELQPGPEGRLPSDVEIALFRIAQEALMNAGKYAEAQTVTVSPSFTEETVELVVQDDGVGFDRDGRRSPSRRGGLGLYGMRERAELLGGTLTIDSAPGQGTQVALVAPLPPSG